MIDNISTKSEKNFFTAKRVVYYILGILEVLLAFRFVFKILGANPDSGFVSVIYTISQVFLAPFAAIFSSAATQGIETKAILEPSTLIAMVVYALVAWGIAKLIVIIKKGQDKDPQDKGPQDIEQM